MQKLAPVMPVTSRIVKGVGWVTFPFRWGSGAVQRGAARPITAMRARQAAHRAVREALRLKLAKSAARIAARKRWSVLYPLSPVLSPLVRTAQGQLQGPLLGPIVRQLRLLDGGVSRYVYRQVSWLWYSTQRS